MCVCVYLTVTVTVVFMFIWHLCANMRLTIKTHCTSYNVATIGIPFPIRFGISTVILSRVPKTPEVSLSLLVELFVCQRPMPLTLFRCPVNPNPHCIRVNLVLVLVNHLKQRFHLSHVVYGGQIQTFLSAVALCLVPGFRGLD